MTDAPEEKRNPHVGFGEFGHQNFDFTLNYLMVILLKLCDRSCHSTSFYLGEI